MRNHLDTEKISQCEIFMGISPKQIENILPCITYRVKDYRKGEVIYQHGDVVENIAVVLEGKIDICSLSADGRQSITTTIEENQLFGEALIFSTGNRVPYDVVAKENAKILLLASDFFMRPCGENCPNKDSHGEVMRNMLRILSDRAQTLNRKIKYLTAPDLRTKISMYLYDLHRATGLISFNMPLNRDGLSQYLSVARPSLSRELINLKKLGVVDFHRSNVTILDLTKLFALSHPDE